MYIYMYKEINEEEKDSFLSHFCVSHLHSNTLTLNTLSTLSLSTECEDDDKNRGNFLPNPTRAQGDDSWFLGLVLRFWGPGAK